MRASEVPAHSGDDHRIHAPRLETIQSRSQYAFDPVLQAVIRNDLPGFIQWFFVDVAGIAPADCAVLCQIDHQLSMVGADVRHHTARLDHAGDLSQSIAQFYQDSPSCFKCPRAISQLSCLLYHTFRKIPTAKRKSPSTGVDRL